MSDRPRSAKIHRVGRFSRFGDVSTVRASQQPPAGASRQADAEGQAMPESTIITTIVQLGAFGVLAYLVIRWQREDLEKRSEELQQLTARSIEAQERTADNLSRVAQVLGQLCAKFNVPTDPLVKGDKPHG